MNKKKIYLSIGIFVLILGISTASYALFFSSSSQSTNNQVTTLECLSTTITDQTNSLSLVEEYPIPNSEGMKKVPYTFTVTNNCDEYNEISIGLETLATSTLSSNYVVASINTTGLKTNTGVVLGTQPTGQALSGGTNNILFSDTLRAHQSKTYDLRIWLNESTTTAEGANKHYYGKIVVTETVKTDFNLDKSGANEPLLADNMIPVYYDETNDIWKKADKENLDNTYKWYDYDNQMWANAVTVTSGTRETYKNAQKGTTILMDDILGMWVWIPRFEYRTDNLGTSYAGGTLALPGAMDIKFVKGTLTTNTTNYFIAPAFRNGNASITLPNGATATNYSQGGWDKELSGFWYGKFETGVSTNPTAELGELKTGVYIKPGTYSLRYQTGYNQYLTAQQIQNDHGIGSQIETHMSKNDEWGAVTYLSQSKYGIQGNNNFSGAEKEIFPNNAYFDANPVYYFLAGRSNGINPSGTGSGRAQYGTYQYNNCPATDYITTPCDLSVRQANTKKGTGASTTGTIYGIYDMSGGTYELLMGNYADTIGNAGFPAMPEKKYYNKYIGSDINSMCSGSPCFGHAWSNEIGNGKVSGQNNWYSDHMYLVTATYPWVRRGGSGAESSEKTGTGIFYSFYNSGVVSYYITFRVVAS